MGRVAVDSMERIYGRLIEKHRRRGAERYFARRARGRDTDEGTGVSE